LLLTPREQVLEAARAIAAEGNEPTYMNVRAKLGTGSFTTIQKHLRDWRTSDEEQGEVKTAGLPEVFTEALNRFGSEAWRAASIWAKDEIEAARRAYEEKVRAHEVEMERAASTVDALQESLNATGEERDTLRREVEELTKKLAAAEATLFEARKQADATLAEERTRFETLRTTSERRQADDQAELRKMERRAIEAETRTKELQSEVERLKEELAGERTTREETKAEAAKVRAERDEARKRLADLVAEREEEKKEFRSYLSKIEEWVKRATEAETRLAVSVKAT
jgi:chromosome segregation ATPase